MVRSIPFLSFIEPIFAWNVPLVSLIFLKRSLVFPILLFSLYFFALIAEEGFLIFPCYSLERCIQMLISFLFSFAFRFSSFHSYWTANFYQSQTTSVNASYLIACQVICPFRSACLLVRIEMEVNIQHGCWNCFDCVSVLFSFAKENRICNETVMFAS